MRARPPVLDEHLTDLLRDAYGLPGARLEFLPIGADINAAKYRVVTPAQAQYFLKLKRGIFTEISVALPQFLHEQGIRQVIPPLKTRDGQLWMTLEDYTCILYPYVEGSNGFDLELSDLEWNELGSSLRRIHALNLPPALQELIPTESWSAHDRDLVRGFQAQVETDSYADPIAAQMAEFMRLHRDEIRTMLERADSLATDFRSLPLDCQGRQDFGSLGVVCHTDLHAWNVLHSSSGLYIIDWDAPLLAPRERDLMFFGGGVGGIWNTPREEALFYQGYGRVDIDLTALTYYRYERILVDVAEYCGQLRDPKGLRAL
jgi:spectinomycin phosphotransferase